MKKLIVLLAISTLLAVPAFAENENPHSGDKGQEMQCPMLGQEQVMAMHQHMEKMHNMMAKINAETNQEKRQQLLQEHMKAMQYGMQMMPSNMMSSDKDMVTAKGKSVEICDMDMRSRMDMMEQRMGMMQEMMGEMMNHASASKSTPGHKHKK